MLFSEPREACRQGLQTIDSWLLRNVPYAKFALACLIQADKAGDIAGGADDEF